MRSQQAVASAVLLQFSDLHVGALSGGRDPKWGLERAIAAAGESGISPDAILLSGDLADNGQDDEYEAVADLVSRLEAPVYVLPGNHDDHVALRRNFELPGGESEPILYAVDVGQLRLVVCDTVQPGVPSGAFDCDRLAWLESELSAFPDRPTVIAMHHAPLVVGNSAWDAIGLDETDRRELAGIVRRHTQVRRIVSGHLHRAIIGELAGSPVFVAPSTHLQARLTFGNDARIELSSAEPPGFVVHALVGGDLNSYVQPLP